MVRRPHGRHRRPGRRGIGRNRRLIGSIVALLALALAIAAGYEELVVDSGVPTRDDEAGDGAIGGRAAGNHGERPPPTDRRPAASPDSSGVWVSVERITDGDTIRVTLDGRSEPVRYIGIDTPETRHPRRGVEAFGPEATEANRRLVEGRQVRLVFDVEERDRYGRLLAYVYLQDGTFVNAELVSRGFAHVMTVPPNVRHREQFAEAERVARSAGRGLWGTDSTSRAR